MNVLVINAGSSSLKYELVSLGPDRSLASGNVERVGAEGAPRDHAEAFGEMLAELARAGFDLGTVPLDAVGHRVVHGGDRLVEPTRIDAEVLDAIRGLELLAPLHTRANLAGVEAATRALPSVPHVAVFDTAFHRTMPARACAYALPRDLARRYGLRRYGFHGTSHSYVARRTAELLGRPLGELDVITLHLGNGASACAVHHGDSIDTSMGMTPLEGLVMGTRCGDVDPAVPPLLGELAGASRLEVHRILNHESGLKGLCGESDMREVHRLIAEGDADAESALDLYCYRVKKYVGAYFAALGRLDALAFTAGVGENDPIVRERVCAGLEGLGIGLDPARNRDGVERDRVLSPDGARVTVAVVCTDEEMEIARETARCLARERQPAGAGRGG